ncbi:transcriptional regulator ExuR [Tolumonas auensis]|jgi:GntR family hexuronate regulon transcriptional repressor|uniref:transcriptional regulator ExuR n=1 Tax=Tolumonas auensis TaxID=43948 RepID=UPI002AA767E0|nr:transcriptional regulator ExuR [Tolumonas auensis]
MLAVNEVVMDFYESKRLYQKVAAELKRRIADHEYAIGDRLPAERLIAEEMSVSRTVVREAIIMLEVEGLVDVRKGSGIHVVGTEVRYQQTLPESDDDNEFLTAGPFELLQARQLLESNIAEFAATQVTKQDILALLAIQETAQKEDRARDSQWDKEFHIQVAKATQNSVLVTLVEKLWQHREKNPYWRKLHEHIDDRAMESWCEDHEQILKALMRKDPKAAKLAMWQHLENTKQMLFQATTIDDDLVDDRYLFSENPVVHLARA